MNKKIRALLCGALAFTAMSSLIGCTGSEKDAQATPDATVQEDATISQIIAFGDSYSDNGMANTISTEILEAGTTEDAYVKPGDLYWENRYSNGHTGIEVAAEKAGLELVNYATGGATSGYENYSSWMDSHGNTGVLGQIEKYKEELGETTASESDLFFIMSGTNDYCKFIDFAEEGTLEDVANKTLAHTEEAIRMLAEVGAENIIISEANDVSTMPYEITEGRQESAKEYSLTVNKQLPEMVSRLESELELDIEIFELTKITDDIVANPESYGFKEHVNVIQPTWPEVLEAQTENLESYMFFDEWHPSAQLHQYIGEGIFEVIETFKN